MSLFVEQSVRVVPEGDSKGTLPRAVRGEVHRSCPCRTVAEGRRRDGRLSVCVAVKAEKLAGQIVDPAQGFDVEDAVGMGVVDDADDHEIVKTVFLFDPIVDDTHRFALIQHVLRVIVERDFRKLCTEQHGGNHGGRHNQPRPLETEIGQYQLHVLPLSPAWCQHALLLTPL